MENLAYLRGAAQRNTRVIEMTERRGRGKATVRELIIEDMRAGKDFRELTGRYGSGGALYDALRIFQPEAGAAYQDARERLSEVLCQIKGAEGRLNSLNQSAVEAEGRRSVAESSLDEINKTNAKVEGEVKNLEVRKNSLTLEVNDLEEKRRKAIELGETTETELNDFTATKKGLAEYGLDMGKADALRRVFSNVSKIGEDPSKIAETCASVDDLRAEEKRIGSVVDAQQDTAAKMETELKMQQFKVADKQALAEQVQEANNLGINVSQLKAVVEAAHEVAALHDLDKGEALDKLESDLKTNWGPKLGFENEATRLQGRKGNLLAEIEVKEEELKRLNAETASKQAPLGALDNIRKRGVDEAELPEWDDVLEHSGCSLPAFKKEVKRLGGVKQFVDAREAKLSVNVRKLEVEEMKHRASLDELKGLEAAVRSQLEEMISESVNSTVQSILDMRKTAGIVHEESTQLRDEFENPQTGLKAKLRGTISEIGQEWKDVGQIQVKEINKAGEDARGSILSVAKRVNDAMQEAFEAGKAVGHYNYINNLLSIVRKEPLEKLTGLATIASALQVSGEWLQANGMGDLRQEFNSLASRLEGRMKA